MMMTARTSAGNTIFFTSASPFKTGIKSAGKRRQTFSPLSRQEIQKTYYSIVNTRIPADHGPDHSIYLLSPSILSSADLASFLIASETVTTLIRPMLSSVSRRFSRFILNMLGQRE